MKRFILIFLILSALIFLVGCQSLSMPFNGDITFHNISLTIPSDFVRDSIQSNNNLWVFEKEDYKQIIILSHKELTQDGDTTLEEYGTFITQQGGQAKAVNYSGCNALILTYMKEDVFCQELILIYKDIVYDVALRGAQTEDFEALLNTFSINTSEDVQK